MLSAVFFVNTVLNFPSLKFSSPHDTLLSGIPYRKVGLLWSHPRRIGKCSEKRSVSGRKPIWRS